MTLILNLAAIAALTVVVALTWDGVAAIRRWRGLRLLSLQPRAAFAIATLGAVAFAVVLALSANRLLALGISLIALPLTAVLVVVRGRAVYPHAWNAAGEFDTHRVTDVTIPIPEQHGIPALLFEPPTPTSAAVVVLHGSGAHKTFYSWPLIDGLLDAGIAVCAIDIDGHGDNKRVLDLPSVLDDVSAPVAWLRERMAWVGVVGVSLGGCIAARAIADGAEVDALALLEAPIDAQVSKRVVRHERLTVARRATWELHQYAGTLPLIRSWRTEKTRTRIGTLDLIRRLDVAGSVARIRCPLLLVYGGSDLVVPLEQARSIAAAAPDGTPTEIIPGATHLSLPIDRRAIRRTSDWLQSFIAYGSSDQRPMNNDQQKP